MVDFLIGPVTDIKYIALYICQAFDTGAENQGQVVACLEENIDKISTDCRDQIRKKEESAAENVELDVALFKVGHSHTHDTLMIVTANVL